MKLRILPLVLLMIASSVASAQNARPAPQSSPQDKKFGEVLLEVRKLSSLQKNEQALAKLKEAEALEPGSPIVQNARGSIYTGMKDYAKARECFLKAEALSPGGFESRFNLTELDFVQGNYQTAADSFAKLLTTQPGLPAPVRSLIQFKILVCQIKLKKLPEAEELAKTFAFKDESPASYFTKVSFAGLKGDSITANEWLAKAQKVFKPDEIAPYMDALAEVHWINVNGSGETRK